MIYDAIDLLFIFVLSVFLGFEVISKVPSILHTPLMSGSNAIHGIILVGELLKRRGPCKTIPGFFPMFSWRPSTLWAAWSSPTGCWICSRAASNLRAKDRRARLRATVSHDGRHPHKCGRPYRRLPGVRRLFHPGVEGAQFSPQRPAIRGHGFARYSSVHLLVSRMNLRLLMEKKPIAFQTLRVGWRMKKCAFSE